MEVAQWLVAAVVFSSFVYIGMLWEDTMIFSFQFFEADEQHKHVEAELRSRLATLEMEAAQHQAVVDGLTRKYMETIEKLQNDKAKLEVRPAVGESMWKNSPGFWKSSTCFIEQKLAIQGRTAACSVSAASSHLWPEPSALLFIFLTDQYAYNFG